MEITPSVIFRMSMMSVILTAMVHPMATVERSTNFEEWRDPASGTVSYVLKTRVAPCQQSLYYINRAMTEDGRYLWFHCVRPPRTAKSMGLVDFATDTVHEFPEIDNVQSSPWVDVDAGAIYWVSLDGILYWQNPTTNDHPRRLGSSSSFLPKQESRLFQVACHLTRNASKTRFFLDSRVDNRFFFGEFEIATGAYVPWGRSDFMLNHAQFSPCDDASVLLCREYWGDVATGRMHGIPFNAKGEYERLWLWKKGEPGPTLIPPIHAESGGRATHEWWGADGRCFYYCAFPQETGFGVVRYDLGTRTHAVLFTNQATHAHASADGCHVVFDQSVGAEYRGCAFRVFFFNKITRRIAPICSLIPAYNPPNQPSSWHPDPHPNFVCRDRYILSTLNLDGRMNLLVTPVAPLIAQTSGSAR